MKPRLFISYSRRQTPFVDRLADELEDMGYSLWLDYQSLVPAKPWKEQIESGIVESDVVLFVVSQESLGSIYVEYEWKHALELQKRIVLVIFEALPLPSELKNCEWVDFRSKYKQRFQELLGVLENPSPVTTPPPQKGFRAPLMFWIVLLLTALVVIGSIPNWWTLVVPYVLLPLMWQVYKRNYILARVIPVLLLHPLMYLVSLTLTFVNPAILAGAQGILPFWFVPTTLASWILAGLLLTPAMQRRGFPEAAWVRFADPLVIAVRKPGSVVFAIDHAPEDARYAEELRHGLESHGHRLAASGESPEAIFVLISTYKARTEYDPERQVVYPVILQPVGDIDPTLQRIQWIDFRKGIRNVDKLAQLLPEPERLLKALAVPPTGTQEIFPLAVTILQYFYITTGVLGGGGLLAATLSLGAVITIWDIGQQYLVNLFLAILNSVLLFGTVLLCVRALRSRKGGAATLYPLVVLTIFQMAIHMNVLTVLTFVPMSSDPSKLVGPEMAFTVGMALVCLFPVALVVVVVTLLFRWRELYHWLPQVQNASTGRLENLLLLYTPSRRPVLILHIIFHVMLWVLYVVSNMAIASLVTISVPVGLMVMFSASCFVPIVLGLHWLARRV